MVNKVVFLAFLFLLLVPTICRADVATGLSELGTLFLIFIVPIEAFVFLIYPSLHNKLSGRAKHFEKIGGWEILAIVLVANLASSMAGSFFQFYKYVVENLITISIAFVLSIIIEWLVYRTYFGVLRRKKVAGLLNICIIGNVATYMLFFFPQAVAPSLSSFDYDRFAMLAAQKVVWALSDYYCTPTNTESGLNLAALRSSGYEEPERDVFGIKMKLGVETKMLEDDSNPRVATWHKMGRRVYLVDKNMNIIEKLKTELDDDLRSKLGLEEY